MVYKGEKLYCVKLILDLVSETTLSIFVIDILLEILANWLDYRVKSNDNVTERSTSLLDV